MTTIHDQLASLSTILPIFKKFSVDFVYLGGSVIEGTEGWWSDLDIFVYKKTMRNWTIDEKLDWFRDLDLEIVQALNTEKVDLHILDELPFNIQFDVISKGKVVYDRADGIIRTDYISWLLPRYYDFKIWHDRMIDEWMEE